MKSAVASNSTTAQPGLGLFFPVSFFPGEVVQSIFLDGNSAAGMCQWRGKILTFGNSPLESGVVIPYMINCSHPDIQFVEGWLYAHKKDFIFLVGGLPIMTRYREKVFNRAGIFLKRPRFELR
jgi:hypothetical protein